MSTAAIPTELTAPGSSSILNKKIRPSDLILTVLIDARFINEALRNAGSERTLRHFPSFY